MDIIIFILYTGIESNPHLVLAGNLHGGHVVSAEEDEAHLGPFSGQRGPQAQAHQPKACPKIGIVLQGRKNLAHFNQLSLNYASL